MPESGSQNLSSHQYDLVRDALRLLAFGILRDVDMAEDIAGQVLKAATRTTDGSPPAEVSIDELARRVAGRCHDRVSAQLGETNPVAVIVLDTVTQAMMENVDLHATQASMARRQAIARVMSDMTPSETGILEAYYCKQVPAKTISEKRNIPVNTIRTLLNNARTRVQDGINKLRTGGSDD